MGLPFPHSVAGGKKGAKRDAGDKPAAKEAAKKAKKEPENASPAGDVEMKDEEVVVGSGRQAAQVCTLTCANVHLQHPCLCASPSMHHLELSWTSALGEIIMDCKRELDPEGTGLIEEDPFVEWWEDSEWAWGRDAHVTTSPIAYRQAGDGNGWGGYNGTMAFSLEEADASAVPLPAALPLLGAGVAGLALIARRRKA